MSEKEVTIRLFNAAGFVEQEISALGRQTIPEYLELLRCFGKCPLHWRNIHLELDGYHVTRREEEVKEGTLDVYIV